MNWYKTAQHILPLSQAKTGVPIIAKLYHGTPDGRFLEEFDSNKKGYYPNDKDALPDNTYFNELHGGINQGFQDKSITGNIGVSFTDSRDTARSYSEKPSFDYQNSVPMVAERYVVLDNPLVIDLKGQEWDLQMEKVIKEAIKNGHDGLIFKNIKDNYHPGTTKTPSNNVIAFNKKSIMTKEQLFGNK